MPATEKAAVCREWTRMQSCKFFVQRIIDNSRLCYCVIAPKQENNGGLLAIKLRNYAVGYLFPTEPLEAVRVALTNG